MKDQVKQSMYKRVITIVLFTLCAALFAASIAGYVFRSTDKTQNNLIQMRTRAVISAASDGLVEKIASQANAAALADLRKRSDFRQLGTATVKQLCAEAEEAARVEAQQKYSNTDGIDAEALSVKLGTLEEALRDYNKVRDEEEAIYNRIYLSLIVKGDSWIALTEDKTDEEIGEALSGLDETLFERPDSLNGFIAFARDQAAEEQKALEKAAAQTEESEVVEETAEEIKISMKYFAETSEMTELSQVSDAAFNEVWAELVKVIPDLETLEAKTMSSIQDNIVNAVASASEGFAVQYATYADQNGEKALEGADKLYMKTASGAETLLIAAIALTLLMVLYAYWKKLTISMGVPRTIILLFFIYLCLAARLFSMNVSSMLGNVLERVGMYGVLVLAMLPGIQCGIGLNMGMTIGCISGLFAIIVTLQFNIGGITGLLLACLLGALVSLPLGWAYSILLNRMKGSEMTISTYVGYSFVSLMCIGWLLMPFYNPKIVFPLRGAGLRVTHSLLDSYAHLLDNFLSFRILGAKVPTGLLLFFLICCVGMWLFTRSKLGIAMTAVGANPRFAEASGINVDRMRTLGTMLSMMIAAVGIVVYSSAFGYAQLYTAPRQLGFITASAILIGGASVSKAKVSHVIIGVFLFEGVLTLGQQVANAAIAGGGLSEVMRIMISNGIILYALTQSGGDTRG